MVLACSAICLISNWVLQIDCQKGSFESYPFRVLFGWKNVFRRKNKLLGNCNVELEAFVPMKLVHLLKTRALSHDHVKLLHCERKNKS